MVQRPAFAPPRADQEPRHLFDGLLRRRQSDARQSGPRQRLQPFQRQREMRAAFVAGDRVDLIDDHGAAGGEHVAPRLRTEQNVQRFRGGHDDVRRLAPHARTFGLRCVSRAHHRANGHVRQIQGREFFTNTHQRCVEIALNVVRQRLQRRHVDHAGLIRQGRLHSLLDELIDRREEGREGLARSCRGGHQHMLPGLQGRPRLFLRGGGRIEGPREPGGNGRMERV